MNYQSSLLFENPEMNEAERLVWSALSGCKGKRFAVKQKQLAEVTGLSMRAVRDAVHSLIVKHKKRIGSSYDPMKGGNYLIQTHAEAQETVALLTSHSRGMFQRCAVVMQVSVEEIIENILQNESQEASSGK